MFIGVGSLVNMVDRFDGAAITYGGPVVSDALILTAETNARFREALVNFCTANAYTQLVTALAGIMLPILAHHGLAPYMCVYMAPEQAVEIEMQLQRIRAERDNNSKVQL